MYRHPVDPAATIVFSCVQSSRLIIEHSTCAGATTLTGNIQVPGPNRNTLARTAAFAKFSRIFCTFFKSDQIEFILIALSPLAARESAKGYLCPCMCVRLLQSSSRCDARTLNTCNPFSSSSASCRVESSRVMVTHFNGCTASLAREQ